MADKPRNPNTTKTGKPKYQTLNNEALERARNAAPKKLVPRINKEIQRRAGRGR